MATHYAHSRLAGDGRPWQSLEDHLVEVGELAARFAPTSLASLARAAGHWHDLGKYQDAFQQYIKPRPDIASQSGESSAGGVPHAAAGASLALERFGEGTLEGMYLALVIEAHHGALKAGRDIAQALDRRGKALLRDARAGGMHPSLEDEQPHLQLERSAMAVRMLFCSTGSRVLQHSRASGVPTRGAARFALSVFWRRSRVWLSSVPLCR